MQLFGYLLAGLLFTLGSVDNPAAATCTGEAQDITDTAIKAASGAAGEPEPGPPRSNSTKSMAVSVAPLHHLRRGGPTSSS